MRKDFLGIICLLLTIGVVGNLHAFTVAPATITDEEGTTHVLQLNLSPPDWVSVTGSECANTDLPDGTFFFSMTFTETGSATWTSDQSSGDLNLDIGGSASPLSSGYTICANGQVAAIHTGLSINIHNDAITGEDGETSLLTINGQCADQVFQAQRSQQPIHKTQAVCPASVTINIIDTTSPPISASLSAGGNAAEPGPPTGSDGFFTISLDTAAPAEGLSVNYEFVPGQSTATESQDFLSLGSSIMIPSGNNTINIPLVVVDDFTAEAMETATVRLLPGTGYSLGASTEATISIMDDDTADVLVAPTSLTVSEDGSTAEIRVKLSSMPDRQCKCQRVQR